jgi:hypothetical protein
VNGKRRETEQGTARILTRNETANLGLESRGVRPRPHLIPLHRDKAGSSAVSVGADRGRRAACGAAPPRSRAPAASQAMALRATLDLRASAAPPGSIAGRPWPALHIARRPRTARLSRPDQSCQAVYPAQDGCGEVIEATHGNSSRSTKPRTRQIAAWAQTQRSQIRAPAPTTTAGLWPAAAVPLHRVD